MAQLRPTRIVVIGGGISGLAAAHRLIELAPAHTLNLVLVETTHRLGGVIQTIDRDGFLIEAGPDCFITDADGGGPTVALCRRLGLEDQLQPTSQNHRGALVARRGKLVPIPDGFLLLGPSKTLPLLRSPIFSALGKLRILAEPWIRPRPQADESLADFVTRRFGQQALDRLIQALVGGIYTADPKKLSLKATLPRFIHMERDHGSVIKGLRQARRKSDAQCGLNESAARYRLFLTCRSGMGQLIECLAKRIGSERIRLEEPVKGIDLRNDDASWIVKLANGHSLSADGVILACPARGAADLLSNLDESLATQLRAIEHASSAVVQLAYRREQIDHALDAFGFVVPHIENMGIFAGSFSSVKFAGRAPEGKVLLRAFLGGALQCEILDADDETLIRTAHVDLKRLLNIDGEPLWAMVHHHRCAMPQYTVGHLQHVNVIRAQLAAHDGLMLCGCAFDGVGIPDCIRQAERAAEQLWARVGVDEQ